MNSSLKKIKARAGSRLARPRLRPGWNPDDPGAGGNVVEDHGARSDHGAGADLEARQHHGAGTEEGPAAERGAAEQAGPRRHIGIGPDPGVMFDQSQAVDDRSRPDAGLRADDRAGEHGRASGDEGAAADLGAGVADPDQIEPARQRAFGGETAAVVVADAERCFAEPACGEAGEGFVVAEQAELEDAARGVRRPQPGEDGSAREQRVGDRARMAAGAENDDAGGWPIRRNRISPLPAASR